MAKYGISIQTKFGLKPRPEHGSFGKKSWAQGKVDALNKGGIGPWQVHINPDKPKTKPLRG